jgi:hypothetical protein
VEPERFDDVGFEILEVPDTSRRRRPRRFFVVGVATCSLASLVAAAALAVTPAQAPQARHGGPGAGSPIEFSSDRYPVRSGHKDGECHRLERMPSADTAPRY